MKKAGRLSLILAISMLSVFSGCGDDAVLKSENDKLVTEISQLKEENDKLKKENESLKNDKEISQKTEASDNNKTDNAEEISKGILTFYNVDDNTLKLINPYKMEIDDNKTLQEKLKIAAQEVSEKNFSNLPIEVVSISSTGKGKIATINLKEDESNEKTWKSNYFQGSTGGAMTCAILKNNLLQKEYSGRWVDGIYFLYEGNDIEFEHVVDISGITAMRNE